MKEAQHMNNADFRKARKDLRMTQAQLGEFLGISKRQVQNIEWGASPVHKAYADLMRLTLEANAPGVPPAENGD
jgi:DNA-binding transcriptional regulator YiaG